MRLLFVTFFIVALAGCVTPVAKVTAPLNAPQSNTEASTRTIQKSELAILLLHGKWGMPPAPLVQQFREAGYKVVSPEMGWSRETAYSINYETSLQRVSAEVESLRQQGFKKVVLGGQSFGANGALAYASIYSNVDALLLFAPGHNPDIDRNRNPFKVNEAKALISSAQPDKLITFTDFNDGSRTKDFSISPQAYLSYFDPDGLASMPKTATNQKKAIPVLVFMGRSDFVTRQGTGYFFNRLPKHPANKYVVSDAEHRQVPQASFPSALQWVESHVLK